AARGLVGDEADELHLPDVVEADDTDECIRVRLLGLLELLEHLGGVSAPEHGQLPHGPVPAIVVSGGSVVLTVDESDLAELEAGHPLGTEQVLDLLQEVLHGERWQVGEGLELLDALNRPHLNKR
ncbi:Os12g0274750, partial [Oryza sativa Japonica Group]